MGTFLLERIVVPKTISWLENDPVDSENATWLLFSMRKKQRKGETIVEK